MSISQTNNVYFHCCYQFEHIFIKVYMKASTWKHVVTCSYEDASTVKISQCMQLKFVFSASKMWSDFKYMMPA